MTALRNQHLVYSLDFLPVVHTWSAVQALRPKGFAVNTSRNRCRRKLQFEPLKSRQVLAASITASLNAAGVSNVIGTDGQDQIAFQQTKGSISIDGVSDMWSASKVKSITIDLKGDNDYVSLDNKSNCGK